MKESRKIQILEWLVIIAIATVIALFAETMNFTHFFME